MKLRLVLVASSIAIVLAVVLILLPPPGPTVAPADRSVAAPLAAPPLAPEPAPRAAPIAVKASRPAYDNMLYRRPSPETIEELMAHPETQERIEYFKRQRAAADRFSTAVDEGGFEVEDLNRSVVSLFKTVELEPVLDDEAMIIGLELRHIYDSSPIRDTDLVVGDLITKINDERLHDPADVPALLGGLERDLSLCVDRSGSEVCRRISLD